MLQAIEDLEKPIVAAIHGTCYGLGTEISLACHARICTDDTKTKNGFTRSKIRTTSGAGGTKDYQD